MIELGCRIVDKFCVVVKVDPYRVVGKLVGNPVLFAVVNPSDDTVFWTFHVELFRLQFSQLRLDVVYELKNELLIWRLLEDVLW